MPTRAATLDAVVTRWRATTFGEITWLVCLAGALALHTAALVAAFTRPEAIDFSAFVDNAHAWLNGNPYPITSRDPNAPHALLMFVPFVWCSARVGLAIWIVFCYACAAAALRLIAREIGWRPSGQVLVTALAGFLAAPAALDVVADGNMVWPIWYLVTVAWARARRGRDRMSALCLGVAMSAKPFLGLWLAGHVLRRQWRAAAVTMLSLSCTVLVSVAVTGLDAWMRWLDMLRRITWYDVRFNASVMGVIARTGHADSFAWLIAAAVVAGIAVWWALRRRTDADADAATVLLTAVLIGPLGWRYYLVLAVGPLLALWVRSRLNRPSRVALAALAVMPAIRVPGDDLILRLTVGSLLFWLLLIAWIALNVAVAHDSREPDGALAGV